MHLAKLLFTLFFLCISSFCVPAQTQVPSEQPTPPLAKFNVIVTDRKGHSVDSLRKEDLQLFDDGTLETISYFAKEEIPLTYGLLIDGSGSLKSQFETVIEAARQMIGSNRNEDESFIVKFVHRDNIAILRELTSDKNLLANSLNGLKIQGGSDRID